MQIRALASSKGVAGKATVTTATYSSGIWNKYHYKKKNWEYAFNRDWSNSSLDEAEKIVENSTFRLRHSREKAGIFAGL